MGRITALNPEEMTAEQKRIHDMIAQGPRKGVRGPLAVWLRRPTMAQHAQGLGQYCRFDSSLPARLSELAILILACIWRSEYEWWAHRPLALDAGINATVIEALAAGEKPAFQDDDEAVIFEFLTELHRSRRVSTKVYDRGVEKLGKDGVIDLVAIAGYYTLISMTLNVFEISPPEGATRVFGHDYLLAHATDAIEQRKVP